jgi:MSHA biogenesis protein MshJ
MKQWQQWLAWQEKFSKLPEARRRLWLLLGVGIVVYLGYWLAILPTQNQIQAQAKQQRQQQQQLQQLDRELVELQARLKGDPRGILRDELQQLYARMDTLEQKLNAEANYVSAADNRALLKALMNAAVDIDVKAAQALPAELVYQDPEDANAAIYKHRLQLSISGGYFQMRDYLHRLEQLEWSFYWQRLDYRVHETQKAEVVLEIYTLSLERDYVAS